MAKKKWMALIGVGFTIAIIGLAYVYSQSQLSVHPAPAPSASPSTAAPNPYRQFDQELAALVERQVVWQAPKRIKVDQTERVGLVIGDPGLLKTEINQLVPGSYPQHAGQVKVGSTIGVRLTADPSDATITPKDAIDKSLGEHTALLWTWYVHAKHPNGDPGLFLTAEIVTKMSDGHVQSEELSLRLPVDRTVQYTLYQIFTNWATWAAIATALSGAVAWIWRRHKKLKSEERMDPRPGPEAG